MLSVKSVNGNLPVRIEHSFVSQIQCVEFKSHAYFM